MTLREFYHECVVAKERIRNERKRDTALAWKVAALVRRSQLPELSALLGDGPVGPVQQTPEQQKTVLEMLSARYGIPLRRTRLIRKDDARQ